MGSGSDLEIRGVSALLRSFALLRSTEMSSLRNGLRPSQLRPWDLGAEASYLLGTIVKYFTLKQRARLRGFVTSRLRPLSSLLGASVASKKKYLCNGKVMPETHSQHIQQRSRPKFISIFIAAKWQFLRHFRGFCGAFSASLKAIL